MIDLESQYDALDKLRLQPILDRLSWCIEKSKQFYAPKGAKTDQKFPFVWVKVTL